MGPLAVIERTYILPGIPKLFQKMVNSARTTRRPSGAHRILAHHVYERRGDLAGSLSTIAERPQG